MGRVIFMGHDPYGRESLEYSLVLRGMKDQENVFERVGMLRQHLTLDFFSSENDTGKEDFYNSKGIFGPAQSMRVRIV
jgi:hypothetical protein